MERSFVARSEAHEVPWIMGTLSVHRIVRDAWTFSRRKDGNLPRGEISYASRRRISKR